MVSKKGKVNETATSIDDEFNMQLASLKLGDALKLVEYYPDADIEVFSTGFPSLDIALNKTLPGMPKSRHIEIFAKAESSGKTGISLAIAQSAQMQGLKVGIIDIEKTITKQLLKINNIVTSTEENPNVYPVRVMRAVAETETSDKFDIYLENVLDTIKVASDVFDLLIVDSVDALVEESEAQKSAEDNKRTGGIAKNLSAWFRENTNKKATVIWINQTRQMIGGYNPTGNIRYVTTGGRALPHYATIRIELSVIEKLKEGTNDPYGFVSRVTIIKNKTGAPWRYTDLYYIFGEGFSKTYDYFKAAVAQKVIIKKGGWYILGTELEPICKIQGELKMYTAIKENKQYLEYIKSRVSDNNIGKVAVCEPKLDIDNADIDTVDVED